MQQRIADEAKHDNAAMKALADAARRDSSAMKSVALLTMTFLPVTATAVCLPLTLFWFNRLTD